MVTDRKGSNPLAGNQWYSKGGDKMIKEMRISKGISQQKLGELVGYSGRTAQVMVSLWENGKRKVSRDKIMIVSKILGIPIDTIL